MDIHNMKSSRLLFDFPLGFAEQDFGDSQIGSVFLSEIFVERCDQL